MQKGEEIMYKLEGGMECLEYFLLLCCFSFFFSLFWGVPVCLWYSSMYGILTSHVLAYVCAYIDTNIDT